MINHNSTMGILLTTGEFAKLVNTTKRTLFLYDELGVLLPKEIDLKGDRLYVQDQLFSFNLLKLLQEAGISLKEIHRQLKNLNYSYRRLFKLYSNVIEKSINASVNAHKSVLAAYSPTNKLLSDFESSFSTEINTFVFKEILKDFPETAALIDSFHHYFTGLPTNPTYILETYESGYKIGVVKEKTIRVKAKYHNQIDLRLLPSNKILKRSRILSKKNEYFYMNNLKKSCKSLLNKPKAIRLIMHNRDNIHLKYLCETHIVL
jgi:DNA-binding transcriptional MerR regulator